MLFGAAYDGWGFSRSYVEDGVIERPPSYGIPPADAQRASRRTAVRRHGHPAGRARLHRRHRDDKRPFFLEVAPYAPHSRVGGTARSRATRASRRRSATGRARRQPGGNCGRLACEELGVEDLPGLRRRPRRQRAGARGRQPGAALPGTRSTSREAGPSTTCATGRGWCSRSTGRCSGSCAGAAEHLRRADVGQRLPPRPARARHGQGRGVRQRHPGAAAGGGSGRPSGERSGGGVEHRPRADVRGPRRASASPRYRVR